MADLRCRDCGFDGEIEYTGSRDCPNCGSTNCQIAISVAEMPDDMMERILASMQKYIDEHDDGDDVVLHGGLLDDD
jgi:uncharacterized Zn finger protein (UPF0148 family)